MDCKLTEGAESIVGILREVVVGDLLGESYDLASMCRDCGSDGGDSAFVSMFPKVAHFPFPIDAEFRELHLHSFCSIIAVEQSNHPVAIRHLAIPNLVVGAVEIVVERLAHKAVAVEREHLGIGVKFKIVSDIVVLVCYRYWASGKELERHYKLTFVVIRESVKSKEISVKYHILAP